MAQEGSATIVDEANLLTLFQQLLPAEFIAEALRQAEVRENNRVYTSAVVMWLMVWQRLQVQGTLEAAVLELLRTLPVSFWSKPCKRLTKAGGTGLSNHTGAYNQGRQGLSDPVVEVCCDHVFAQLVGVGEKPRQAFFLDGTTLRTAHTKALVAAFPPTRNQHGVSHWPILRMLVAHDLYTGLAMRPVWGPVNGDQAVSEQGLLESAIDRLPESSVLCGDSNFGVFSVAYVAANHNHPVVLRLTEVRARCLTSGVWRDGVDQHVVWKPSREDRRSHPDLPAPACVEGRVVIRQVQPSNGAKAFLLALFTTLPDSSQEIVALYGQRWSIEVDLRTLKCQLRLEELRSATPRTIAKEINLAMMSYNLVRSVMHLTARKAGLEPRAFSFTKVRNVLQAFLPLIAAAEEPRRQKLIQTMLACLDRTRLYQRQRPSSPRALWPKPKSFPARHQ
jgi:putative transposase